MGKKAKSKAAKPKATSQPTKSATSTLTTGQSRADGLTMSQTQKVLQEFFNNDEDKLASYGERLAREQQKHQLEEQAVAAIGDWLVRKAKTTARSFSQPPLISQILVHAITNAADSEETTDSANTTHENAASVALPTSSEDEDMDVSVASRKRVPNPSALVGGAESGHAASLFIDAALEMGGPCRSARGVPRGTLLCCCGQGQPARGYHRGSWPAAPHSCADPCCLRRAPLRTSPPAAPPAEPAGDPRDALITKLLAALQAVGDFLPSDHPIRSVCLQAASAQSGATTVD
ncbi:hypothetical protein MTO96_030605 [Rhipicephalus appendiculatus]